MVTKASLVEDTARTLAVRLDRRGFLGRVGLGLVAVGAGDLAIQSKRAVALAAPSRIVPNVGPSVNAPDTICGCPNCGNSTTCSSNPLCPSGTCDCGSWYTCTCPGPKLEQWRDCCNSCGTPTCGGDGKPKCYYHVEWSSGCNNFDTVQCRTHVCTNMLC